MNEREGKQSKMERKQDGDGTNVRLSVKETEAYTRNFNHKRQESDKGQEEQFRHSHHESNPRN